ncbi:glutamate-1-semialdehyde 2,1-aminomutase [Corynespora cassiicola Philippines]|uniref:Glutamate-1-semialdehyde 2,1-aminomutase n=1 Tax=Corynespora cassiicola Philippines TaxID=1448308 RepID=A0A2T2NWS1_CORCC|nr:glutamate-1-semialdehyde 2,1-aminomutase [Corynespora cassiicola Philippines]
MAPPIATPTQSAIATIKLHVKSGNSTVTEALEAAKARFVERNPTSLKLHEEATKSLPGGNTRSLLHTAPFPLFIKSGEGYRVTSEDGHAYTDLVGELTAGLFGHLQPQIQDALVDAVKNTGLNLGGTTKLEARHAGAVCKRFGLERLRFTNSGTEANMHALFGAKKFTGRRKVVVFSGGYHGGCFSFPQDRPAENCVDKEDWIVAEYNDVEDAKSKIEESGDVAAVLVEGMQGHGPCIVGTHEFLQQVQESARKVGAVFILDEVMTSRLAPGGLQELESLTPDMTTLGKWLGGGITFGAFGGRKDIMKVYDPRSGNALGHSGTFNNNTLGMVAGYTGLSRVYTPQVAREFSAVGERLKDELLKVTAGTKMTATGRGTIIGLHFLADGKKELKSYRDRKDEVELRELFWFEMMEDGYWITQRGSIALILGTPQEELDRFVKCVESFLKRHASLVNI